MIFYHPSPWGDWRLNTYSKKDKPASINMAEAKFAADITITGPIILGNICLNIILKELKPKILLLAHILIL